MSLDLSTLPELRLDPELVAEYRLDAWAQDFSLMTAGYRDRLDPDDPANPDVSFNSVTLAILAEAKARVFESRRGPGGRAELHVGGEVRPNTPRFIDVLARVYAAHGFVVHLRKGTATTPIWYSSFGILYDELESGDNLTASHSPYFKGGWKPLDAEGKQLTVEEPDVVRAVREIVATRATIPLASRDSPNIRTDFDVDEAYVEFQRRVLGSEPFRHIREAGQSGFFCAATPLGGSMGVTTRRLFDRFGIRTGPGGIVRYFLDEEDERFHRVGEIGGENLGADPSKKEICRNLQPGEKLNEGGATAVFVWDPDGDRFNVVTTTSREWAERAAALGVEVEPSEDGGPSVVYLSPNQLYLTLVAHRVEVLRRSGELEAHDWFLGISYPTSLAIEEFGSSQGLPVARVPTGFKNLGDLCRVLEEQAGKVAEFESLTGKRTVIGRSPRALFLCEESGGASMGADRPLVSGGGRHQLLALREKDGFQVSLMTLGLLADLHQKGSSLAQAYCEIVERGGIDHPYSCRKDVLLYDESLMGDELRKAKASGVVRRDQVVEFFRRLAFGVREGRLALAEVGRELAAQWPADVPLPTVRSAAWIGDGTMLEFDEVRVIIRASGTDALLRYYVDAKSRERMERTAAAMVAIPR